MNRLTSTTESETPDVDFILKAQEVYEALGSRSDLNLLVDNPPKLLLEEDVELRLHEQTAKKRECRVFVFDTCLLIGSVRKDSKRKIRQTGQVSDMSPTFLTRSDASSSTGGKLVWFGDKESSLQASASEEKLGPLVTAVTSVAPEEDNSDGSSDDEDLEEYMRQFDVLSVKARQQKKFNLKMYIDLTKVKPKLYDGEGMAGVMLTYVSKVQVKVSEGNFRFDTAVDFAEIWLEDNLAARRIYRTIQEAIDRNTELILEEHRKQLLMSRDGPRTLEKIDSSITIRDTSDGEYDEDMGGDSSDFLATASGKPKRRLWGTAKTNKSNKTSKNHSLSKRTSAATDSTDASVATNRKKNKKKRNFARGKASLRATVAFLANSKMSFDGQGSSRHVAVPSVSDLKERYAPFMKSKKDPELEAEFTVVFKQKKIGFAVSASNLIGPFVSRTLRNGLAELGGVSIGDRVIQVNDVRVSPKMTWQKCVDLIKTESNELPMKIKFARKQKNEIERQKKEHAEKPSIESVLAEEIELKNVSESRIKQSMPPKNNKIQQTNPRVMRNKARNKSRDQGSAPDNNAEASQKTLPKKTKPIVKAEPSDSEFTVIEEPLGSSFSLSTTNKKSSTGPTPSPAARNFSTIKSTQSVKSIDSATDGWSDASKNSRKSSTFKLKRQRHRTKRFARKKDMLSNMKYQVTNAADFGEYYMNKNKVFALYENVDTLFDTVLGYVEKSERACVCSLKEIYKTEYKYTSELNALSEFHETLKGAKKRLQCKDLKSGKPFCEHMRLLSFCKQPSSVQAPAIGTKDLQAVFLNLKPIMKANVYLKKKLQAGLGDMYEKLNNQERVEVPEMLDVFCKAFSEIAPFFKMYYDYCFRYLSAVKKQSELRASNPTFLKIVTEIEKKHKTKLSSLLDKPFQRITRYQLLFNDLRKYVAKVEGFEELGSKLQQACDDLGSMTQAVNAKVGVGKNMEQMVEIFNEIGGINGIPDLLQPYRRFERKIKIQRLEHVSMEAQDGPAVLYLFNDMIVLATIKPEFMKTSSKNSITKLKKISVGSKGKNKKKNSLQVGRFSSRGSMMRNRNASAYASKNSSKSSGSNSASVVEYSQVIGVSYKSLKDRTKSVEKEGLYGVEMMYDVKRNMVNEVYQVALWQSSAADRDSMLVSVAECKRKDKEKKSLLEKAQLKFSKMDGNKKKTRKFAKRHKELQKRSLDNKRAPSRAAMAMKKQSV